MAVGTSPTPIASLRDTKADTININLQLVTPSPKVAKAQEVIALQSALTDENAVTSQQSITSVIVNGLPHRYDELIPFFGRTKEQALVRNYIKQGVRLIQIYGRAGVGKTGLVCKVLDDLEQEDLVSGIVSLKAGETQHQVSLDRILSDFARLLPNKALSFQPDDPAERKISVLLDALRDRRYILLLDNLEALLDKDDTLHDPDMLSLFVFALQRGGLTILVTTHHPLRINNLLHSYERSIPLDNGLSLKDAIQMLRRLDTNKKLPRKNTLLKELIKRVDGFPRALEAAMGLLVDSPTLVVEDLLQDTALFQGEVTKHIVEKALSTLPPIFMRVMEALALFGQPVSLSAIEYLLAPYIDWSQVKARDVLDRLIMRRFVSYNRTTKRYSLHPLDWEYCERQIPGYLNNHKLSPAMRFRYILESNLLNIQLYIQRLGLRVTPPYTWYALNVRAAHFFQAQRKIRVKWKALSDLDPLLSEFEYLVRLRDYDTAAELLSKFDFDYLLLWGHTRLIVSLHERLIGKIKDHRLRSIHLGSLGIAYFSLGEVKKAIEMHKFALSIDLNLRDRHNEGIHLGYLGIAYFALGDITQAIDAHSRALIIARELGHRPSQGIHLANLGNVYSSLGEIEKTIDHYRQGLKIAGEIGDKRLEEGHLGNLGSIYSDLGEIEKAIDYYQQALSISREIGDRYGQSINLGNLGSAYSDLGEIEKAIDYYQQALFISREIGDKYGEISHMANLSQVFAQSGNYIDGKTTLQQSLIIADEIQSPSIKNYMSMYLAEVHLLHGELTDAWHAIEMVLHGSDRENNYEAIALSGVISLRLNDDKVARTAFYKAANFTEELLKLPQVAYQVRYTQALAQAGLAIITNLELEAAYDYYNAGILQCAVKGVVQREIYLLEQLAMTRNGIRLEPILILLRAHL